MNNNEEFSRGSSGKGKFSMSVGRGKGKQHIGKGIGKGKGKAAAKKYRFGRVRERERRELLGESEYAPSACMNTNSQTLTAHYERPEFKYDITHNNCQHEPGNNVSYLIAESEMSFLCSDNSSYKQRYDAAFPLMDFLAHIAFGTGMIPFHFKPAFIQQFIIKFDKALFDEYYHKCSDFNSPKISLPEFKQIMQTTMQEVADVEYLEGEVKPTKRDIQDFVEQAAVDIHSLENSLDADVSVSILSHSINTQYRLDKDAIEKMCDHFERHNIDLRFVCFEKCVNQRKHLTFDFNVVPPTPGVHSAISRSFNYAQNRHILTLEQSFVADRDDFIQLTALPANQKAQAFFSQRQAKVLGTNPEQHGYKSVKDDYGNNSRIDEICSSDRLPLVFFTAVKLEDFVNIYVVLPMRVAGNTMDAVKNNRTILEDGIKSIFDNFNREDSDPSESSSAESIVKDTFPPEVYNHCCSDSYLFKPCHEKFGSFQQPLQRQGPWEVDESEIESKSVPANVGSAEPFSVVRSAVMQQPQVQAQDNDNAPQVNSVAANVSSAPLSSIVSSQAIQSQSQNNDHGPQASNVAAVVNNVPPSPVVSFPAIQRQQSQSQDNDNALHHESTTEVVSSVVCLGAVTSSSKVGGKKRPRISDNIHIIATTDNIAPIVERDDFGSGVLARYGSIFSSTARSNVSSVDDSNGPHKRAKYASDGDGEESPDEDNDNDESDDAYSPSMD